jgi:hypothetical protein
MKTHFSWMTLIFWRYEQDFEIVWKSSNVRNYLLDLESISWTSANSQCNFEITTQKCSFHSYIFSNFTNIHSLVFSRSYLSF